MKNFLISVIIMSIVSGCTSSKPDAEENIAVVAKYVQAVQNEDYETMESLLGEDYYGYGPSYNDSISRSDALSAWKENISNLYESIEYEKSRNLAEVITDGPNKGNWVSNYAQLSIKYKDGRGPVKIWANTVYKLEDGKIVKSYTFYNEADALRQLGYVFINPNDL